LPIIEFKRPVAVRKGDLSPARYSPKARETGRLAALHPAKERPKGKIEPMQYRVLGLTINAASWNDSFRKAVTSAYCIFALTLIFPSR
jgi:hypothetical protein